MALTTSLKKRRNMKISAITSYLERIAPLSYQESYDNSGLIVGNPNDTVQRVLIALDCTEAVVDEAIEKGCGLIITHHPIVFKGLKKFNGKNYVERVVLKAIKNDIALYAIHTNLDNVLGGVNSKIAEKLGLENTAILNPKSGLIKKLTVFVPRTHVESVRTALFEAGAGAIGDYDECSFNSIGYGTFRAGQDANPTLGEIGQQERVEETKIEVVFPSFKERSILVAMYSAHPYEEVAHDLITLENTLHQVGSGIIGNLPSGQTEAEFLGYLKEKLNLSVIRHTPYLDKEVVRVAICGGAGSFLLEHAKRSGANVFVTGDFKYHEFFDAEDSLVIADIGHFESEQYTQELLFDLLHEEFVDLPLLLTEVNTNPVKYYY